MAALEQPSGSVTGHPEAGPHSEQSHQAHTEEAQQPSWGPLPRGTLTLLRCTRQPCPTPHTRSPGRCSSRRPPRPGGRGVRSGSCRHVSVEGINLYW